MTKPCSYGAASSSVCVMTMTVLLVLVGHVQSFTLPRQQPQLQSIALQMARVPEITRWKVLRSGAVQGIAKFHPVIEDGDDITTSPLEDVAVIGPSKVVKTKSGSSYRLVGASTAPIPVTAAAAAAVVAASSNRKTAAASANADTGTAESKPKAGGFFGFGGSNKASSGNAKPAAAAVNGSAAKQQKVNGSSDSNKSLILTRAPQPSQASSISIGNGAYILAGVSNRSTSGKSQIWKAYRSDANGNPVGEELVCKLSSNYEALSRENDNYNKVAGGLGFTGAFCKKFAFLDYAEASKKGFDNQSALIIQAGLVDLKELLKQNKMQGLPAKALRDAAAAAGKCVQAMHAKRMVWTDLKTENFVILDEPKSSNDGLVVRGIDLESAQSFEDNPSDFSPEACPPEFAEMYLSGYGPDFVLKPSYDIWSLGMLLFELSTGKPYFFKKSGTIITTTLRAPTFVADVSAIEDAKLQDLVAKCLEREPSKRPSITTFLLHPYFTTTGFGSWSF